MFISGLVEALYSFNLVSVVVGCLVVYADADHWFCACTLALCSLQGA